MPSLVDKAAGGTSKITSTAGNMTFQVKGGYLPPCQKKIKSPTEERIPLRIFDLVPLCAIHDSVNWIEWDSFLLLKMSSACCMKDDICLMRLAIVRLEVKSNTLSPHLMPILSSLPDNSFSSSSLMLWWVITNYWNLGWRCMAKVVTNSENVLSLAYGTKTYLA